MEKFASIPTKYNGVNFRSRLEARWAAFFDLLKWEWEYEPIDLNGWIPDFKIKGAVDILVEVKPYDIRQIDRNFLYDEYDDHEVFPEWQVLIDKITKSKPHLDVLLLGYSIEKNRKSGYAFGDLIVFFENGESFIESVVPIWSNPVALCIDSAPATLPAKYFFGVSKNPVVTFPILPFEEVNNFWKEAGNITQWRKK